MNQQTILLEKNSLWKKILERTEEAKQSGALLSIPTEYEIVESDGIPFLVRIISNLVRKDQAKKQEKTQKIKTGKDFNPFLPYEEDLFVTDVSQTHLGLLNKYNVVDHHLLIVTRAFEEQESLINLADFTALAACLAQIDGLGFYNSGTIAGASVRHKHLQLIPLPFLPNQVNIPIEFLFDSLEVNEQIGVIPQFSFAHGLVKFDLDWSINLEEIGKVWLEKYQVLLKYLDLINPDQSLKPYNLLATRNWLLIVPRSQEFYQSISINSLGFAGALLVRNQEQLALVKQEQPLNILAQVGC